MGFQFYTHLLCLLFKASHFIFKNNLDLVCNLFRYLYTWLVSIIIFKRTLLSYWTKKGIKCWVLAAAWHVQFEIDIKLLTFVEFYIHLPQNLLLYFAYFVCHIDMHHGFLFKMCRCLPSWYTSKTLQSFFVAISKGFFIKNSASLLPHRSVYILGQ